MSSGAIRSTPEAEYWSEFEEILHYPLDVNYCDGDPERSKRDGQSPVDVRDTGGRCKEYHMIRSRVSFFF